MPPHTSLSPSPSQVLSDCEPELPEYTPLLSEIRRTLKTTPPSSIPETRQSFFSSERCTFLKVRGVFQVAVLSFFSWMRNYRFLPKDNKEKLFVMIQGIAGAFSFICALLSVVYMPVSDALVIMFSDPLVTMVAAAVFLRGERLTVLRLVLGACILAGVTLVCRPPFIFPNQSTDNGNGTNDRSFSYFQFQGITGHDKTYWTGAGFAIGAVLTGTYHNVIVPLCKDVKSPVLVLWVGLAAIIVSSIAAQFDPNALIATGRIAEMPLQMWLIILGLAVSGMLAYLCLTRALQLISPTLVSSLRSLEIVFAYGTESIIHYALPMLTSIFGAVLVIIGVTGIALEVNITQLIHRLRNGRREGYEQV